MEKMVPMEIRQSMFEEPSKGSKQTTYLPCNNNRSSLHKAHLTYNRNLSYNVAFEFHPLHE